jgi:hypothetical protein
MANEETKTRETETEAGSQDALEEQDVDSKEGEGEGQYGPALIALLSDPDINAVLQAKRAQKGVRVVVGEDGEVQGEEEEEGEGEEDEELTLDEDEKKAIDRLAKILDRKLKPFGERLSSLEGLAQTVQRDGIQKEVSSVKKKYPDLDKYRKVMAKLADKLPGANVEELYLIAKARAGELAVQETSTFSEKPTESRIERKRKSGGQERKEQKEKEREAKAGSRGFRTALQEVLEDMEFDI